MKQLINKSDFVWYKKELDVEGRYEHRHNNEPEKFPCQVTSNYWDDPNGPYTYDHSFSYQQEIVCGECSHKTLVWPNQADEL